MRQDDIRFVQLLHPGGEHRPDASGFKAWNADSHRRKFLEQPGRAIASVSSTEVFKGNLRFWAEWEPDSKLIKKFDSPLVDGPKYLFRPLLRPRPRGSEVQNTDPFVFGKPFYYCICQQVGALRRLERGSVILFGSCRKNEFILDTVFVVARWRIHTATNYRKLPVSSVYRKAALEPLYDSEGRCGGCPDSQSDGDEYRLYEGATFDDPCEGMFSFFPCIPAQRSLGFARPIIRARRLIISNLKQSRKISPPMEIEQVREAWKSVAAQVRRQRLQLGVYAELPRAEI